MIGTTPCDNAAILTGESGGMANVCRKWVLAASILGSSMAFIDGTVVNVALPALQSALRAGVSQVQWIVEAYALFLASLLLAGGAAGDRYGRRKVFLIGVVLFTVASAGCGFARNIEELIAMRGLQGAGAALLVPGSLALISAAFPEEERGRAIGTWSGVTAITSAIGPLMGGWLIQHAGWRWIFFLNLPFGLAVAAICLWRIPESAAHASHNRPDWPGAALATGGLAGIVFALVEGNGHFESVPLLLIACAGALSLAAFVFWERRAAAPMLPLELFRSRNFAAANLLTFCLYAGLSGVLFFLPLNLIQIQGYSPTEAGAALLPFVILMFTLSRWSGGLVQSHGARLPLTMGPLLAGLGFALFARAEGGGSYWTGVFPAVAALGLGMSIAVAPLTATVMGSVDRERAGIASGINNAVSRLAGLLGVAAFGLILIAVFNRGLDRRLDKIGMSQPMRKQIDAQRSRLAAASVGQGPGREAIEASFLDGYRVVLWSAAGLAVASACTAAALIQDGRSR